MAEVDVEKIEKTEAEIEIAVRARLEEEFNTRLQEEILNISKRMTADNEKIVTEAIERFKADMQPPQEEDIQKLLDQEYLEYTITVPVDGKKKIFTIKELPNQIEKKIYKAIKNTLVPFSSELASSTMNLLDGDASKKIIQLMNTFDPILDLMVDIATIVLDPYEEDEKITEEWVSRNFSSTRLVKVVTAQIECNRMRDFFSLLFRGSKLLG